MNNIAITNIEKSKRILDSIEARDTSTMGYEAKLRHAKRIEEARRAHEELLAADRSNEPVSSPAKVNS